LDTDQTVLIITHAIMKLELFMARRGSACGGRC
jgi:hypothetical protein